MKMFGDARGNRPRYHPGEVFGTGQSQAGDASKFSQQLLHGSRTDAGNFVEFRFQGSARAALPVKTDGEAVRFVADLLNQMQQRRMSFQADRFVLLAEDEQNLFLFGDCRHRLIDDFQLFQGLRGGVELSQ